MLTKKEFIEKHCHMCGSQRCEGIGTEWFDGCPYRHELAEYQDIKEKLEKAKTEDLFPELSAFEKKKTS